MRLISHTDPAIKPFEEVIAGYTSMARALGLSYWLYIKGDKPIGLLSVGKEPVQLFAPISTPVARIQIIDFTHPAKVMDGFLTEVHAHANKHKVELVSTTFPSKYEELISTLEALGFQQVSDSYRMVCPLNQPFRFSGELVIERVKRDELAGFITTLLECMSGSPDAMLNIIMKNVQDMPDQFLDIWYNMEHLYWVYKDGQVVGVLDLNLGNKYINNIGVAPTSRGKGFGRQIMLFALKTLMQEGGKHAGLRVHKDNTGAIKLYESLGFTITEQNRTFLWRRDQK
jgi:ribosomal protein S18 acetylase RimI-like enzyme